MADLTEQLNSLTTSEYAELGQRLAKELDELREMQNDAAEAMKELKQGIERKKNEIGRLVYAIRTGQRELAFGEPQPENGVAQAVKEFHDSIPADSSVTFTTPADGKSVTLHGKKTKGKATGK